MELGDFEQAQARAKARAIADGARIMGLDVVCPGETDLALGLPLYKELSRRAGITSICANVKAGQDLVFPASVVRTIDGVRVGFLGLLTVRGALNGEPGKPLAIEDPTTCARVAVQSLKGRVDVIVAITHLGFGADLQLSREVPEIGVIIGGHSKDPWTVGGMFGQTAIFQGGYQGRSIGQIRLKIDRPGGEAPIYAIASPNRALAIEKTESGAFPMEPSIKDDESCAGLVAGYRQWLVDEAERQRKATTPSTRPVRPADGVWGAACCSECHQAQARFWQGTAHARACETLVRKARQFDVECLMCHTTRFAQTRKRSGKAVTDIGGLESVQCEACHATGSLHETREIRTRAASKATCLECHDPRNSPRFEFETWLPRVRCPPKRRP